jgi:membrane protein implicated in regulation of membrane protease activity
MRFMEKEGQELLGPVLIIVGTLAAFMTLTYLAAWLLIFLLGTTSLWIFCAAWAAMSLAGVILLRRLARRELERGERKFSN